MHSIEKPLFDIGYAVEPAADTADDGKGKSRPEGDEEAREPCVPDFLLWAHPAPRGGREAVIVETMG